MIFPLVGIAIGATLGAFKAKSKGGANADMAQWGAVFAMIGGVIGLFIAVIMTRATI